MDTMWRRIGRIVLAAGLWSAVAAQAEIPKETYEALKLDRSHEGALHLRCVLDDHLGNLLVSRHQYADARDVRRVQLARRLGLEITDWWAEVNGVKLGVLAEASGGVKLDYLVDHFEQAVGPIRTVQAHGPRIVHKVGIISGFGADHIEQAAALGCDTFITGETSHAQYYEAMNAGINVIYGGHYTTETVGVQALGRHLVDEFGLSFEFVDLPTDM